MYVEAPHTMKNKNTTMGAGNIPAAQRIVAHPDGNGFALLDTFGDYLRHHRGFVMQFTKAKAAALLGVDLSEEKTA